MDENTIIDQLEELTEGLRIQVHYEAINLDEESIYVAGGLCQVRGEYLIIINSRSSVSQRIQTLAKALKHFDLNQVYIKPVIRELLDGPPSPSSKLNNIEEGSLYLSYDGIDGRDENAQRFCRNRRE